ncbi:hypothetical protein [Aestuariivita boseongensis]|uniref:hypothetical protein n=1 Tax=Aestuariivita boseongensis TaxID=1470562 RepID=UPI000680E129|nr:hypothetical protein [Aestuariivita boseongensis]
MSDDKLTDTELDALFKAAQRSEPGPSPEWTDRVFRDAQRVLAGPVAVPPPSLWSQVVSALGGWQGMGGLAAASAAGLWIGISPPALLDEPLRQAMGAQSTLETLADTQFEISTLLDEG